MKKNIILSVVYGILTYALLSYCEWNFNLTEWHAISRLLIFLSLVYPFSPKQYVKV